MIVSALCALAFQQPGGFVAGRYELAERMRRVDVAWMAMKDPAVRRQAVEPISKATMAYFGGRGSDAAMALDEALAKLESRKVRASDALNVRPDKPFSEPGATVSLQISWAYLPQSVIPVRVGVGANERDVRPGKATTLNVNPWVVNSDLRLNQEVGYLMPVRVGIDQRFVFLSFVRKLGERLDRLKGSGTPYVSDLAKLLDGYQRGPGTLETELPLIQYLFSAEAIEDGKTKLPETEQIYSARQDGTVFRAAFPRDRANGPVNVVVALHGAGGSENMFFELYGRGMAASEALKRGWAFMSPRVGPGCIQHCLDWLAKVRGVTVGKVFLMGHSMGGGYVLSGKEPIRPAAIATFAPAAAGVAEPLGTVPLFVGVGKSDPLAAAALGIAQKRTGPDFKLFEVDPCEHMMVVSESIPEAYSFFDRYAAP